ncbi:hypothetical protein AAMO2058_000348900 [Amorphochlora amoebiformis]
MFGILSVIKEGGGYCAYAAPGDPREEHKEPVVNRRPNWYMMTPLVWAPIIPLWRISTFHNRNLQRNGTLAIICLANLHAFGIFFSSGAKLQ